MNTLFYGDWSDHFLHCGWVSNNTWSPGMNSFSFSSQPYTHDLVTFVSDDNAMYLRIAHLRLQTNNVGI